MPDADNRGAIEEVFPPIVQGAPSPEQSEPPSVAEGFTRINRTPEQISETAELILHHPKLEYDQGDGLSMEYDDAFDLAEAFLMVLGVAERLQAELDRVVPYLRLANACGYSVDFRTLERHGDHTRMIGDKRHV